MFAIFVCPTMWALATCPIHALIALDVSLVLSVHHTTFVSTQGTRNLEPHCKSMCATAGAKELDKITPTYGGRKSALES